MGFVQTAESPQTPATNPTLPSITTDTNTPGDPDPHDDNSIDQIITKNTKLQKTETLLKEEPPEGENSLGEGRQKDNKEEGRRRSSLDEVDPAENELPIRRGVLRVRITEFLNPSNKDADGDCCMEFKNTPTCKGYCRLFFR